MSATKVSILTVCGVALTVAVGQSTPPVDAQSARPAILHRSDVPDPDAASPVPVGDDQQEPSRMLLDDEARRISFQALLTNEQGGPISQPNGEHELDFRLYDSEAGGVAIGTVLDVLVTLDGGVASTQVGPLDPTWFDGTARWMGVTVDNGDELEPLIPLGSVPYAFRVDRVASAELDDDIDLGDETTAGSLQVFDGDGHVGVNINGGPQWVLVNGQDGDPNAWLRAVSFSLGPVSHGHLSLYDETGNTETVQLTANSNTGGLLSLFDTNAVLRSALRAPASGGLLELHDSLGHANLSFNGDGAAIDSLNSNLTMNAGSAQNVILATGGGNVGIGTNSPDYPLHVETTNSTRAIFGTNTATFGVTVGVYGENNSNAGTAVLGRATATSGVNTGVRGQSNSIDGVGVLGWASANSGENIGVHGQSNSSNGYAGYFTGAEGSRNYFQRNVGIGTENPDSLLHLRSLVGIELIIEADINNVGEDENARLVLSQDGGQVVARVGFREGGNGFEVMQEYRGSLTLGTSDTDRIIVTSDGDVMIQADDVVVQIRDTTTDNSANAARLELLERAGGNFDGGAFFRWNGDTNRLLIGTKVNGNDTPVLTVDRSSSNVGIGTTDPESLLHLASLGGIDLIIDADTNNIGESQNARLVMRQDGGQVVARVGFREGDNSLEIMQEFDDSLILGTNNLDRMTITSSGNVGIGTNDPTTRLHVQGGNDGTDILVRDGQFARMRMIATDPASDVTLSIQARGSGGPDRAEIGTVSSHDLVLFSNGTVRIRIDSDGSVCIGGGC